MASVLNAALTTETDLEQISSWTKEDEYHQNDCPEWWLTGNGALSFRLDDEQGPVVYIRLDEGDLYRLHCQFAPTSVVSRRRLVHGIVGILPHLVQHVREKEGKGLVFSSISPKLVRFMKNLGFEPSWEHYGEYVMMFGEK